MVCPGDGWSERATRDVTKACPAVAQRRSCLRATDLAPRGALPTKRDRASLECQSPAPHSPFGRGSRNAEPLPAVSAHDREVPTAIKEPASAPTSTQRQSAATPRSSSTAALADRMRRQALAAASTQRRAPMRNRRSLIAVFNRTLKGSAIRCGERSTLSRLWSALIWSTPSSARRTAAPMR